MEKGIENFNVSVIIPAYNAERTIKRTLESIYKQTRRDLILEVLVVNDGSCDATSDIVRNFATEHSEFCVKIIEKANGGVSTARNAGMTLAKGTWIALCDSDDEWIENKIELQYKVLSSDKKIDFLGGNHTDTPISILGKRVTSLYNASIKDVCIKMFPQPSTTIFRRKIFEEIGGFDEDQHYAEDGQYFLKICSQYGYFYHPKQVVIYDGGKRGFGGGGLSGNLQGMQEGNRKNMRELYQQKRISLWFFVFIMIFNELKYLRRLLICRLDR